MSDDPLNDTFRQVHLLGIDPLLPFYDLNLAGEQGAPDAHSLAQPTPAASSVGPTFTAPDRDVPELAPYDLIEPGITLYSAQQADPLLPERSAYAHPLGLDVQPASTDGSWQANPPSGLTMQPTSSDDPAWADASAPPALRSPDLTQHVHMPARPGDLAPDALQVGSLYQQTGGSDYPEVFMDGSGAATSRARHLDLLLHGLQKGGEWP